MNLDPMKYDRSRRDKPGMFDSWFGVVMFAMGGGLVYCILFIIKLAIWN